MIFKMGNFLNIYLIKEMATSCSLTSKETKSWTFTPPFHCYIFQFSMTRTILELFIFYFKLHCSLIFGKCVSFILELQRETSGSEKHSFVRIPVLATVLAWCTLPSTWRPTAQILHPRLLITVG